MKPEHLLIVSLVVIHNDREARVSQFDYRDVLMSTTRFFKNPHQC